MTPPELRRYRADRLLRRDFHARAPEVLAQARRRLAALGVHVDDADLQSCYAQAWQGLYATVLAGEVVATPTGWLVTVTVRRAIDEQRSRASSRTPWPSLGSRGPETASPQPDPGQHVDDVDRLREVFEALRGRLSRRECEAASLCYLQGLSRAEAARQMGLSRRRMDKLMDGTGSGSSGVAAKVGELLAVIRGGRWCDEQASLMRGLAFGLLDPHGERYRLALVHQRECPACRAYVASLRRLAAVLPPLSLPIGALARAGAGAAAGGNGAAGTAGSGSSVAASAAAGSASATGGGWLLAGGSVTAKVAASCLIALGLGAGCVVLDHDARARAAPSRLAAVHHRRLVAGAARQSVASAPRTIAQAMPAAPRPQAVEADVFAPARREVRPRPALAARREFGVESVAAASPSPASIRPIAVIPREPGAVSASGAAGSAAAAHAQREFGVQ